MEEMNEVLAVWGWLAQLIGMLGNRQFSRSLWLTHVEVVFRASTNLHLCLDAYFTTTEALPFSNFRLNEHPGCRIMALIIWNDNFYDYGRAKSRLRHLVLRWTVVVV